MHKILLRRARLASAIGISAALTLAVSLPARGLTFNMSYDRSVALAPAGLLPALTEAISSFSSAFSDSITLNIAVGWGEIAGRALSPGSLGQSLVRQPGAFTYGQVRMALVMDAKSSDDALAAAGLPLADPTGGKPFRMANAEAKALGLLAGDSIGIDGWVGFDSSAPYTFDARDRAVADEYDFIGLAEHEISEVMGRYGMTQNGCAGCASPLDLFRYTASGVRNFVPIDGAYFSIDNGSTVINKFNGVGGGDLSDWLGLTADAFNHAFDTSLAEPLSAGDFIAMDIIGYDRATQVPEPTSGALFGIAFAGYLVACYWRKSRVVQSSKLSAPGRMASSTLTARSQRRLQSPTLMFRVPQRPEPKPPSFVFRACFDVTGTIR